MKKLFPLLLLSVLFKVNAQKVEIIPSEVYRTEFTFFEEPLVFEKGKFEKHDGDKFLWEDAYSVTLNPYYYNTTEESIALIHNGTKEEYDAYRERESKEDVKSRFLIYKVGFYELFFKAKNTKLLVVINITPDSKNKLTNEEIAVKMCSRPSIGLNFFLFDEKQKKYIYYGADNFINLAGYHSRSPKFNDILIASFDNLRECYTKEGARIIKNKNPFQIEDKTTKGKKKLVLSDLPIWLKDCKEKDSK